MNYAPSFYHFDQVARKTTAAPTEEEEEDTTATTTAIEPAPAPVARMPVYSVYLQAGMAPPAYNTLVEQHEIAPAKEVRQVKKVRIQEEVKEMEPEQPVVQEMPTEMPVPQQYKQSMYVGFAPDVTPAYNRARTEKHVAFAAVPVKEKQQQGGSRLVKPVVVEKLPEPQSTVSEEYSAIEGDAFRPVLLPHSEYQFGQLNDLKSYVGLKQ